MKSPVICVILLYYFFLHFFTLRKNFLRGSADVRQSLFICIGGLEFLRNIKDCVNANLSLLNTGKEIILYVEKI